MSRYWAMRSQVLGTCINENWLKICYLLYIIENLGVLKVVSVGRLISISDSSKVKFTVLICVLTQVTSMVRYIKVYTSIELLINGSSSPFGK
jgi:hypothetical protein